VADSEKKKVMIIDDEESIHTLTKVILKDYDVTSAFSGTAALDLFAGGYTPNFVLLDLFMPEMNGWETYAKIREIPRLQTVPIAIYTTSEDPRDKIRAQEIGAADYIVKPAKRAALQAKVAELIQC
jgi:putative two-component system response regulator